MFKKKDKSRAQSMVELALILPIVLLVVLGLIEFGRAFFYYTMISGGAREGARYGCVHMEDGEAAVTAGVRQAVYSRLIMIPPSAVTVNITYDDGANPIGYTAAASHLGDSRIVVEVQAPFSMITPIIRDIFPPTTIHFTSARTTQTWVKAVKVTPGGPTKTPGSPTYTPLPTDTPGGPTHTPWPTDTPGGPTDTPRPPTDTPLPPQALNIMFVSNYPCKQNGANKPIRVKAYVTDGGGNPVSDATVTVSIAGGPSQSMTPISGQPGYYGNGTNCWESASIYTDHQNVTVNAAKSGFTPDSDTANTSSQALCGSCP